MSTVLFCRNFREPSQAFLSPPLSQTSTQPLSNSIRTKFHCTALKPNFPSNPIIISTDFLISQPKLVQMTSFKPFSLAISLPPSSNLCNYRFAFNSISILTSSLAASLSFLVCFNFQSNQASSASDPKRPTLWPLQIAIMINVAQKLFQASKIDNDSKIHEALGG
jgi:hypothetical protein